MATAPRKQVSCRLAAVALVCLAHAGLSSRPAAAQPPSFRFIHAAAVAAYAASIAQRAATAHDTERATPARDADQRTSDGNEQTAASDGNERAATAHAAERATPAEQRAITTSANGHAASSARADAPAPARMRAPSAPKQPPPLPSVLERLGRLGGEHAKRAMQVAQGVPAGRVALRPMFWMTRDQRGGMVALGGRF